MCRLCFCVGNTPQQVTSFLCCSQVARVSGLNTDTTWGLLTGGFDSGATLEDVVGAVEDVYYERKLLAYALANNQTVVQASSPCSRSRKKIILLSLPGFESLNCAQTTAVVKRMSTALNTTLAMCCKPYTASGILVRARKRPKYLFHLLSRQGECCRRWRMRWGWR